MSREITVNCSHCNYKGQQEIGNDGFDQEYPFCPSCCNDLTFNSESNAYT